MLKSYDKVLDNAAWIKQATIYKETTVTTKAKIFYFHGGGLLYGFRKDLPEKHISVITQAGYEIISFDYPLAPAADLEQIVPDICDSAVCSLSNLPDSKKILTDFSSIGHSSGTDTLCGIAYIFQNLHYLI